MVNWESKKLTDYLGLGILLATLSLLGLFGNDYFFRLDLTEEKRYTLSPTTENLLEETTEEIYVELYLDGDLPPGFIRLRKAIIETLEEFKHQSASGLTYRIIDPNKTSSERARNEFIQKLAEKGIPPTDVFATENAQQVQRRVFPGAIVTYRGEEVGVNFLKGGRMGSAEEALNQSIEGVEYELAAAIQQLSRPAKKRIGIVQGHNEWDSLDIAGLTGLLNDRYDVFRLRLSDRPKVIGFDALIVAGPKDKFTEADKYKLDQFLMSGGKLLFFLNSLYVNMDSATNAEQNNFAIAVDLNLDDLLFKYGVRINGNYIQDINSGFYPVVTGNFGDRPDIRLMPWPFYPVINNFANHPTVRNLDAVWTRFVSSMDTVRADGIKKHPLLMTSPYTRVITAPAQVRINDVRDLTPSDFQSGTKAVGYLLEGSFSSLFKNRFLPDLVDTTEFRGDGFPSQVLVVADGDFVRNEKSVQTNQAFPVGFDPYDNQQFANGDFIINVLQYMLDEQNLILARNKTVQIRPLDRVKAEQEKTLWQVLNIALPLFFVLIFGVVWQLFYRAKYRR